MQLSADYPRFCLRNSQLSHEQKAFFQRRGFLHFRQFAAPEAVQGLLQAIAELEQQWLQAGPTKINGVPIKYGHDADGTRMVQRFAFASQHSPRLHAFLQDTRLRALLGLLDAPGARMGENEKNGLVVNHYVNVPGSTFAHMGWHTDALRDVFEGRRIGAMLNVGIHLDDCPAANGGLRVLPGTHCQSLRELLFRKKYFASHEADPNELAIETQAGDLTVHDGRLWHRVARSPLVGAASRRRVLYVPIVAGPYQPKHAAAPTPLYLRFLHLLK
ncbi:phytanoyl-CoA dioxygenase family protein [Hymenobacter latericus]|uniref:phytanoyl-CoA dioxygenase family protein n=1 Tax=Hymenobacter sp. YIM 151858-1 TaxID=2987688 RepID=UPI00222621C8|nr:phytanoyl-CoA dioxygenase family protein [Hymenobacter sp. YIM 151858-1]UYZ58131.1 phytanoyl-CoA dioxygenase family protein [Hymenobacter sp. YIM 151858-1]